MVTENHFGEWRKARGFPRAARKVFCLFERHRAALESRHQICGLAALQAHSHGLLIVFPVTNNGAEAFQKSDFHSYTAG